MVAVRKWSSMGVRRLVMVFVGLCGFVFSFAGFCWLVLASLIGAAKALARSSKSVSMHWHMWCCDFGKTTPANRKPVLDPTLYNFACSMGFLVILI